MLLSSALQTMQTSSDVMKELCILPTVKSSLVSTHKATLSLTSSTKKFENQPSLRDYVTKTSKTSVADPFREPNSRYVGWLLTNDLCNECDVHASLCLDFAKRIFKAMILLFNWSYEFWEQSLNHSAPWAVYEDPHRRTWPTIRYVRRRQLGGNHLNFLQSNSQRAMLCNRCKFLGQLKPPILKRLNSML